MPNVDFRKKAYKDRLPAWQRIKDVLKPGAVRAKGDIYLPRPNAEDESKENETRYQAYLTRAVFLAFTARTLRGMCGQVFSRPSIVELPEQLAALETDVDGEGLSIMQLAKKCVSTALSTGRCGILVDMPETDGAVSVADVEANRILPKMLFFNEEEIINWDTDVIGGHRKLTLLVLEQEVTRRKDTFEEKEIKQWLVLRLLKPEDLGIDPDRPEVDGADREDIRQGDVDVDQSIAEDPLAVPGTYVLEVWKQAADSDTTEETSDRFTRESSTLVIKGDGTPWGEIPFQFIGWDTNEVEPNEPPLDEMAELNIGHWRNSADYQESTHIAGQATPVLAGLTESWVKEVMKGKVFLGSRAAILLPENGSAELLQAAANSAPKESMEMLRQDAVAIGARLIDPTVPLAQSATAAAIDAAEEVSVLMSAVENVTEAINQGLWWAGQFINLDFAEAPDQRADADPYFELNTDFAVSKMTPEERKVLMAEWQSNGITTTEYRRNLERGGVAHQDKEEYEQELQESASQLPANPSAPGNQTPPQEDEDDEEDDQ
jgi:hypothetical protein